MSDSIREYPPLPMLDMFDSRDAGKICREWADKHPAANCQADRDILSYIAFLQCVDREGRGGAYVRLKKIAEKVGRTRRAVINRINRFVELGAIRRERQSFKGGKVANQPSILIVPQDGQGGSEIVSPGGVKDEAESFTPGVKELHGGSETLDGELHGGSETVSLPGVKGCTPYTRAREDQYSDSSISDSNISDSNITKVRKARHSANDGAAAPDTTHDKKRLKDLTATITQNVQSTEDGRTDKTEGWQSDPERRRRLKDELSQLRGNKP